MHRQYWVIGADYGDMDFTQPVDGTAEVHGPFGSYNAAKLAWRERATESRYKALTRFTIVSDIGAAGGQQTAA